MAIGNYSELKTAVENWLDGDSLTVVDDFIDLAEARHARDIRISEMETRATATTSTTVRYLNLPTGYLGMRRMVFETNPITTLEQVSPDQLVDVYSKSTSKPKFFAVHEEIEFNCVADSEYTADMVYWKAFTALSDSNTTNGLLTNHPDVYLSSCLAEAFQYIEDDARAQFWEAKYRALVRDLKKSEAIKRHSQGALHTRAKVEVV